MGVDRRVAIALRNGEIYAAHQALIAAAQKAERAGNVVAARTALHEGLSLLAEHGADAPTRTDVARRYAALCELVPPPQDEVLACLVHAADAWPDVARAAQACAPSAQVVETLLKSGVAADDAADFYVSNAPTDIDAFAALSRLSAVAVKPVLVLLSAHRFASAAAYIGNESIVDPEVSDTDRTHNLAVFLLELLLRKSPPRDLFDQLERRYSDIVALCPDQWDALRETYWPSRRATATPLAAMLQSMMSGR